MSRTIRLKISILFICLSIFIPKISFAQKTNVQNDKCEEKSFIKALLYADQVHREVWRVLSQQSLAEGKTIAGRLARAYNVNLGKAKNKSLIYTCDRYQFIKNKSKVQIFLKCGPQKQIHLLADVSCLDDQWKIKLNTAEFSEILGLATSILAPAIECEFLIKNDKLFSYSCMNYHQDISGQKMIMLEKYTYERNRPIQIEVVGYYLENLRKTKKLSMKVPFEGQIDVTETLLNAPANEKNKEQKLNHSQLNKNQRGAHGQENQNNQEQAIEPSQKRRNSQVEQELEQGQNTEELGPVDEDGVPQIINSEKEQRFEEQTEQENQSENSEQSQNQTQE